MTARLLILTGILGIMQTLPGCSPPTEPRSTGARATRFGEKPKAEPDNDPAGDLAKLQGRWRRIPHGEGPTKWPEAYLIIKGHQLAYDHAEARARGLKAGGPPFQKGSPGMWGFEQYRFVLDSGSEPKKMRFTHMWKDGCEIALPRDHPEYNKRYTLDNGILRIWTMWAERHEQSVEGFERLSSTSE